MHRLDFLITRSLPKAQLSTLKPDSGASHQSHEIKLAGDGLWRNQSHI